MSQGFSSASEIWDIVKPARQGCESRFAKLELEQQIATAAVALYPPYCTELNWTRRPEPAR